MSSGDYIGIIIAILAHGPAWVAAWYAWKAHRKSGQAVVEIGRVNDMAEKNAVTTWRAADAAAKAAEVTARVGERTTERLEEVHIMVNGRLEQALAEIQRLRAMLDRQEGRP